MPEKKKATSDDEDDDTIPLSPTMKALLAGIPAANLADIITTERALGRGGTREWNPTPGMGTTSGRVALKTLGSLAGIIAAKKLYQSGHKKAGTLAAIASIAIPTAAAVWNAKQGGK